MAGANAYNGTVISKQQPVYSGKPDGLSPESFMNLYEAFARGQDWTNEQQILEFHNSLVGMPYKWFNSATKIHLRDDRLDGVKTKFEYIKKSFMQRFVPNYRPNDTMLNLRHEMTQKPDEMFVSFCMRLRDAYSAVDVVTEDATYGTPTTEETMAIIASFAENNEGLVTPAQILTYGIKKMATLTHIRVARACHETVQRHLLASGCSPALRLKAKQIDTNTTLEEWIEKMVVHETDQRNSGSEKRATIHAVKEEVDPSFTETLDLHEEDPEATVTEAQLVEAIRKVNLAHKQRSNGKGKGPPQHQQKKKQSGSDGNGKRAHCTYCNKPNHRAQQCRQRLASFNNTSTVDQDGNAKINPKNQSTNAINVSAMYESNTDKRVSAHPFVARCMLQNAPDSVVTASKN